MWYRKGERMIRIRIKSFKIKIGQRVLTPILCRDALHLQVVIFTCNPTSSLTTITKSIKASTLWKQISKQNQCKEKSRDVKMTSLSEFREFLCDYYDLSIWANVTYTVYIFHHKENFKTTHTKKRFFSEVIYHPFRLFSTFWCWT